MKKRKLTVFGKFLKYTLGTLAVVSFVLLLGVCSDGIDAIEYVVIAGASTLTFAGSVALYNKIFE